ncbi:hypothetical protein HNQ60_002710 [Povalibacter uvarum]|uniref:Uncharacterized protein n=1 Tax=Povalibacter uvarum TaxID=732238 RepID=A0A841HNA6_9GAMM|nr:hypothetical protein [Povalibacter uvarum]MBB6093829.1 hypothetical protein [Povalibacter uvarum]
MQKIIRSNSLTKRLSLIDEEEEISSSPSYFEWRERTARPAAPPVIREPRPRSLIRLFRRIARKD